MSLPYFKILRFSGQQYQLFTILATIPWNVKSSIGLLSDSLPLFGTHKRSYLILFSIFGSVSLLALTCLPMSPSFGTLAMLLYVMVNLQVAAVDLLTEAKYAQLMVSKPETGSDVVSFSQSMYALGGLLASLVSAPLLLINPRFTFLICLPLSSLIIIPCILPQTSNFSFPERVLNKEDRKLRIDKYRKYPSMFYLSFLMTGISILLVVVAIVNPEIELIISLASTMILIVSTIWWLPPTLRQVNLYLFLNNALYVPISGALNYFFTADERCIKDGPHFSLPFYLSVGSMVTQLAYFMGAILFQLIFSKGYIRRVLLITNLIKIVSAFFDVALVTRFSKNALGIPDSFLFIFGDAVVYHISYRLELIPLIVLTSKLVPTGIEAVTYALLVSFQNFGGTVGQSIGYALMEKFQIQTVEPCNFDGLPALVVVTRVIMPTLALPLIFWLIPRAKLTDDFRTEEDEEYRQHGSAVRNGGDPVIQGGEVDVIERHQYDELSRLQDQ